MRLRASLAPVRLATARVLSRTRTAIGRLVAELLLGASLVLGWGCLTWGIAALTTPHVWPISAGLFFLSLCGWRFLAELFGRGLYTLTRDKRA